MARGAASIRSVCLAGPTASGKSALAIAIAKELGGTVVNADSMQVYADLNVITARPTNDDMEEVPHRLYGDVNADQRYSAGRFVDDAGQVIEEERHRGRVSVFTGGTGLYFKGLIEGFSPIPAVPDQILGRWNAQLADSGPDALHAVLADCDPVLADRIAPGDSQRIVRALSVNEATGRPLSYWQAQPGSPLLNRATTLCLFLDPERDWLAERIDRRFEAMMEAGAVQEVEQLHARKLDPTLPAMRAHGVSHLIDMLEGRLDRKEAIARGQADTRAYAKRQRTWFRGQMRDWQIVRPGDTAQAILGSATG
ncbi:MAG: tRNA (adenosine(37)-N6)-dimethylallyltransferase MiaA [Pseudomonadota bacterium]